ncbi:MAG: hypothetical protein KGY81_07825 [Phycisphaerae bacterium]|jgi:hypothetical protein|nr:hypothetical protein [Phycisphaerae bacterium]
MEPQTVIHDLHTAGLRKDLLEAFVVHISKSEKVHVARGTAGHVLPEGEEHGKTVRPVGISVLVFVGNSLNRIIHAHGQFVAWVFACGSGNGR